MAARLRTSILKPIVLIVVTAAVMFVSAASPVLAAAPRDAIKNMPSFSYRSTLDIDSDNTNGDQTYRDTYVGTWDIGWRPSDILLGTARAKLNLHYRLQFKDSLNRIDGSSGDARNDLWTVKLNLLTNNDLKAHFELSFVENASGSSSSTVRTLNDTTAKTASVQWQRNNWPALSVGYVSTHKADYNGTAQSGGSEVETANFKLDYAHDNKLASQRYTVTSEMMRSQNYMTGANATSSDKTTVDARREMRLGDLGRLQMGLWLEEKTSNSVSSSQPNTTHVNTFSLGLVNGRTKGPLPLRYKFNYNVKQVGYSNSPGNQDVTRLINFKLDPPVPSDKQASLILEQRYHELEYAEKTTSDGYNRIEWSFTPNPRTSTSLAYKQSNENNLTSLIKTSEKEEVRAAFNYHTPGNKSKYSAVISENITRRPSTGQRTLYNRLELKSAVNLGPKANFDIFYNQAYTDTYHGILSEPTGTDLTETGFHYSLTSDYLSVSTSYTAQHFYFPHKDTKRDKELVHVQLVYKAPAGWSYQFVVQTDLTNNENANSALGYNYKTEDRILATVTYSF